MRRFAAFFLGMTAVMAGPSFAQEVQVGETSDFIGLTEEKAYIHVIHEGRAVKVQRVQDPDYALQGYFAKTGRKCPPFCLRPVQVDPRVATFGEVEVFDFMENELRDGQGMLIDARTPSWFQKGTIPGSVNVPFTDLSKEPTDPALVAWLERFGAKARGERGLIEGLMEDTGLSEDPLKTDEWDFTDAKTLVLWCNGPACGQSPRAIKGLLNAGYPPEKLGYYRGGMQLWQLFGLTTVVPGGDTVSAGEVAPEGEE